MIPDAIDGAPASGRPPTVRDASIAAMAALGLSRIFGNPGRAQVPLLTDLPASFSFVLGLNDSSAIGLATGFALATGTPACVSLATLAGLRNALGAIVHARASRAPLLILVGGHHWDSAANSPIDDVEIARICADAAICTCAPAHPQLVPTGIATAFHEALQRQGPALVVVPAGFWDERLSTTLPATLTPEFRPKPALAGPGSVCDFSRLSRNAPSLRALDNAEPLDDTLQTNALQPERAISELARHLPDDVVLVSEASLSRDELLAYFPTQSPSCIMSVQGGCPGSGLTNAIGMKMAIPDRPVIALVGDESALCAIQALWTAAQYGAGVLIVVMNNHRYAAMDELARLRGSHRAWPDLIGIDVVGLARGFDCHAARVRDHEELSDFISAIAPRLRELAIPFVLDVQLS